ncbi:hypothetical protein TH53_19860 [Pedobacter lusitanus]|uniref:Uncharacterized protein n=1 Tax=Pedobacter lusitanus TaxID=1503925 RepID=A0A0D0GMA9_9SPHI|nr:hypothetical protein [Pedobacter lusitanus]KIO75596.1 hypothetical protein TH53_19860 [Pedobacter lusitanus]
MGIINVTYNWRVVSDGHQTIDCADEYHVGVNGVVTIEEHQAMGSGDRWFYNIVFDNGNELKIFNPNTVLTTP